MRRVARLGAVAYAPYGPLVADGDAATLSAVLDVLQGLVRQERLLYLKLQPPPGGIFPLWRRHDGAARIRAPSSGRAAHDYDGGSGRDARSLEAPIVQVTDG